MAKPMKWRGQYVDEMDRDALVKAFREMSEEYEAELSKLRRELAREGSMPSTVQRVCKCGKTFTARTADVRRGWGRFCSKSCAKTKGKSAGLSQRPVVRAQVKPSCIECGDDRYLIGADGLCDHCAYMNEPQSGWDDHKH